jgi:hypothetical protein
MSLHWLHARTKRPVGERWQDAPFRSYGDLMASYQPGYNVGVRLGAPSKVTGGYLHAIDMDIRVAEYAETAWIALAGLLPIDPRTLPCVASGSGGASRHLYFITDQPFRSKRLWTSEGKHRTADGSWHYDAEIELFGTGKQVVLPPSIHPTGKPYRWEREFDLIGAEFGL